MRLSEFLLLQMSRMIVDEERNDLIEALPQEDDLFISETLMAVPGAVFFHLQISKSASGGHVGKVCRGFDTVETMAHTIAKSPRGIADTRDELLDNQDFVFGIILHRDC